MRLAISVLGHEVLAIEWDSHDIGALAAAIAELARRDEPEEDESQPFDGGHTVSCSMERELVWPEPQEDEPEDHRPRLGFGL